MNNVLKKKPCKKALFKPQYLIISILAIVLAVPAVLSLGAGIENSNDGNVVIVINGENVTAREFKQYTARKWPEIMNYFIEKYGAEPSGDFWNTDFGGKTPSVMLKEASLEQLIECKLKQHLAKENGILGATSYESFLESLEQENKRRNRMLKQGEIIYGPKQYDEFNYFDYFYSNMEIRLKEKLKNDLTAYKDELKLLYEENKEALYKNADTIRIHQICIPYAGDKASLTQEQARRLAEEVKNKLDKGEDFIKLAKEYTPPEIDTARIFDEKTNYDDEKNHSELLKEVKKLSAGEISDVLDIPNGRFRTAAYYIIECVEKKESGYKPFSEVIEEVRNLYFDDWYDEVIEKLTESAEVEIHEKVYEAFKVN